MVCWGSWSNTQKLAAKTWRFELFYWDFVLGLVLTALLWGFTAGSFGEHGRTFVEDLNQANGRSIFYATLVGTVWNLGNLLLVAAIAVAGMSVAFPIGSGIAWLGGIIFNFIIEAKPGEGAPVKMKYYFTGNLNKLMKYMCKNGYEHHVAMVRGHVAEILDEAIGHYLGWDLYNHDKA